MGMLYKRGNVWWIKYHRNGKPIRESSRSKSKMVADRLLKRREGEVVQGKIPGSQFEKVIFDDLAEGLFQDYKINKKKSLARVKKAVEHLQEKFSECKVVQITTPAINEYILYRLDAGASNATVNRELSALKRMFNLGYQQTPPIVERVPYFQMLKENNVRKGFFEHWDFLSLRDALPDYLKGAATFAYKSGWRIEEVVALEWSQIDRNQGIVRIEADDAKNGEARTVYLDEELQGVFQYQWEVRKMSKRILPYVFLNRKGDDRLKRFYKTWKQAFVDAGVAEKLFHDFRRTAVRNMIRSGIPERVAMMISGHKTRSVFDRYNIVNDHDLKLAAQQQSEYLKSLDRHNLGTVSKIGAGEQ